MMIRSWTFFSAVANMVVSLTLPPPRFLNSGSNPSNAPVIKKRVS